MLSWLRSFKLNEYVSSNKTNNSAIRSNVGRDGCVVFEHHFETVVFDTPSCSASHRPVLFFSTNISFSLTDTGKVLQLFFSKILDPDFVSIKRLI